jgi:SAM-dependent methyltransferase
VSNSEILAKEIAHFARKEAWKRDQIVINYFGESGVNRIVNSITELLLTAPKLPPNAKVLDVGAGTGFFTIKIAEKVSVKLPKIHFYAMDITPAMLLTLVKKNANITPFFGVAENINGSIKEARKHLKIPLKFDAIFSTLMLHHSSHPERIFRSLKKTLKKNGKAILVDLCEHSFREFKDEMGDIQLGFNPKKVYEMAKAAFSNVKVDFLPGIRCECSGRSAELFVAYMWDGSQHF